MSDSQAELPILLKLIDDPDSTVHDAVMAELVLRGSSALLSYHQAIDESPSSTVRQRLLEVIHRIQRVPLDQLVDLLRIHAANDKEVDLEEALILLDRFGNPTEQQPTISRYLDELALNVHKEFITKTPAADLTHLLSLHTVLFEIEKYRGADQDYYDPRNSYLSSVIRRKEGIPVSLAAIELLVAERVGLDMYGVAMPLHFLLYSRELDLFIDPFHHGTFLSKQDCVDFVIRHGINFDERMLAPVTNTEMIIRMLRNLSLAHEKHLEMWESQVLHHALQSLDPTTHS